MSNRGLDCGTETKVQQHFKSECDIRGIINRHAKGMPYPVTAQEGVYMDLYNAPDFREAMTLVTTVQSKFDSLPARIRTKFENDPEKLLKFVSDPENTKEAIELGLVKGLEAPEAPDLPTPEEKAKKKAKKAEKAEKESTPSAEAE